MSSSDTDILAHLLACRNLSHSVPHNTIGLHRDKALKADVDTLEGGSL